MALQSFGSWTLFLFPNLYTVGRTPWTGNRPFARPLPTNKRKINAQRHPCLEWNSNLGSQYSSGQRHFMPQNARPQCWNTKYNDVVIGCCPSTVRRRDALTIEWLRWRLCFPFNFPGRRKFLAFISRIHLHVTVRNGVHVGESYRDWMWSSSAILWILNSWFDRIWNHKD
jgi:hypothetical protein